jgi:hypothetical protein
MASQADIPMRKRYTARRFTARGTKISRAVFRALYDVPIGRYTTRTAVHTGIVSGLYTYSLFYPHGHRARTHSLTNTYPHPRPFHDVESEAHHACRGRGPAFRFGDTHECRSAHAICGDGYGTLRRERHGGSCARGRYRSVRVPEKASFATTCGND